MSETNQPTDKTSTIIGKLKTQVRKLVQNANLTLVEILDIWTDLQIKELRDRSPSLTEEQANEMVKLLLEQGKMAEAIPSLPFMRDCSDAAVNKSTDSDKTTTNSSKAQAANTNGKAKTKATV